MQKKNGARHFPILGLAFLIVAASATAAAQNKPGRGPDITFTVSIPKPHTNMLDVEVGFRGAGEGAKGETDLIMPRPPCGAGPKCPVQTVH